MTKRPTWKSCFTSLVGVSLFICCFITNAYAQLCTGSFGEPILNITFGSGSTAASLGPGITSYSFVGADCPNDGNYTLRSSTSNCFGTWHTITADHTGNPQGRFMLANASYDPGDFYVQQVSGLCANTTFEFAAWVMNMVRVPNQIQPNLTFSVEQKDGTVLGMHQTGDIGNTSTPLWKKVGFNFTTPPGITEVVLRIRNNAPGGIGNDLALDDITFQACGPSLTNTMNGNTDTVHLCEEETNTFQMNATVPPFFSNPRYQWQVSLDKGTTWNDIAGETTTALTVAPEAVGTYWYRLSAAEAENFQTVSCRVMSNVTAVNIYANPAVSAGPDKVVIKGEAVTLQGTLQGENLIYQWLPLDHIENAASLTPRVSPPQNSTYMLSAVSAHGCSGSDEVLVKVINGIYIPTSFTPNGDGLNDVWQIPHLEHLPEAEVRIFNRYGNLVYHTRGSAAIWNGKVQGKPQPSGVYIYLVTLKKGAVPVKGFITLIR